MQPVNTVAWPSGLRRQLKALVREGVGSNPTAIIEVTQDLIFLFCFGYVSYPTAIMRLRGVNLFPFPGFWGGFVMGFPLPAAQRLLLWIFDAILFGARRVWVRTSVGLL